MSETNLYKCKRCNFFAYNYFKKEIACLGQCGPLDPAKFVDPIIDVYPLSDKIEAKILGSVMFSLSCAKVPRSKEYLGTDYVSVFISAVQNLAFKSERPGVLLYLKVNNTVMISNKNGWWEEIHVPPGSQKVIHIPVKRREAILATRKKIERD